MSSSFVTHVHTTAFLTEVIHTIVAEYVYNFQPFLTRAEVDIELFVYHSIPPSILWCIHHSYVLCNVMSLHAKSAHGIVSQARLSHGEERVWSNSHQAFVLYAQQQGT